MEFLYEEPVNSTPTVYLTVYYYSKILTRCWSGHKMVTKVYSAPKFSCLLHGTFRPSDYIMTDASSIQTFLNQVCISS